MKNNKVSFFWFRRDLRLDDNRGLQHALKSEYPIIPVFIFVEEILDDLPSSDPRITFIHQQLHQIQLHLNKHSSSLYCKKGIPEKIWEEITENFDVQAVFTNEDYEPYAIKRDKKIKELLETKGVQFNAYKDQVIFEKDEIIKNDGTPYTVFTPYKNKWIDRFKSDFSILNEFETNWDNLQTSSYTLPSLSELEFKESHIKVHDFDINHLQNYHEVRNFPALNQTSALSPHLRFGTVSIRKIVKQVQSNEVFLSELIWREFFMQILFHFPAAVHSNFRKKYDLIEWRNNVGEFEKWKTGQTGYPIVDAGMRELNATGYMHNRVRMVVAGFLCKHLLIDWRWGEAYFAEKLLDYDLSANNGNWQWAAGTGCDAAPYFRVFNPTEQIRKFDKKLEYINKWVPELNSFEYPAPIVEHKLARERAIATYKKGIELYSE